METQEKLQSRTKKYKHTKLEFFNIKALANYFSTKDLVLISFLFIGLIHIPFRGIVEKYNTSIFLYHPRNLPFTIFMIGVYIKFIILSYCFFKPNGVNKNIPLLIFICSIWDIIHWFTFSGLAFWEVKLMLEAATFVIVKITQRYV